MDWSYFPPNGCKVKTHGKGENKTKKLKEMGTPDGGRIGWGFVVVREHKGEESEVQWADQGTCESDGISEETTNMWRTDGHTEAHAVVSRLDGSLADSARGLHFCRRRQLCDL